MSSCEEIECHNKRFQQSWTLEGQWDAAENTSLWLFMDFCRHGSTNQFSGNDGGSGHRGGKGNISLLWDAQLQPGRRAAVDEILDFRNAFMTLFVP